MRYLSGVTTSQGEECSYITDNTYSKREILRMEEVIWGALGFQLTVPTPRTFLRRFIKASAADWPPSSIWRSALTPYQHLSRHRECPNRCTMSGIPYGARWAALAQHTGRPDV